MMKCKECGSEDVKAVTSFIGGCDVDFWLCNDCNHRWQDGEEEWHEPRTLPG